MLTINPNKLPPRISFGWFAFRYNLEDIKIPAIIIKITKGINSLSWGYFQLIPSKKPIVPDMAVLWALILQNIVIIVNKNIITVIPEIITINTSPIFILVKNKYVLIA